MMEDTMSLTKQQAVVITGSTSGIGKAIALLLAQEGYTIVLNYSSNDEQAQQTLQLCQQITSRVVLVKADVSKKQQVERLMQTCFDTFHSLDVLVNNAARVIDRPVRELTED